MFHGLFQLCLGDIKTTESPRTKSISLCFTVGYNSMSVSCPPLARVFKTYFETCWVLLLIIQLRVYRLRDIAEHEVTMGVVSLDISSVSSQLTLEHTNVKVCIHEVVLAIHDRLEASQPQFRPDRGAPDPRARSRACHLLP